jgi:transcriptional regulator GlxA family with amidase domain
MGVSPASYMHNVRLERAHEELLMVQPGDGVTVGDVALRWGFQHAGRFAVYYRQRFGESPSETLRSSQP